MILIIHVALFIIHRATEMPQRPSPRAPHSLRTSSSSDSDPVHHRSRTTERSPRLSDGRSPRAEPLNQRKLGSRIADLESQLGQAQDELKSLKNQLASAEAAKAAAQELLDKKSRKPKRVPSSVEIQAIVQITGSGKKNGNDEYDDDQKETDVFEVPVEKAAVEELMSAPDSSSYDDPASKNDELALMKSKLDEKEKDVEVFREENAKIKNQLHEKISEMEEMSLRLKKADQEVEKIKESAGNMKEKLEAAERTKEELENEMKKLRVQTEQWRKAADAAATVLAGEVEINGRRISERCGSMEKSYGSSFDSVGGYVGSPNDSDGGYGGGKRKGSGIKMFGDLWRKKGNK